MLDRNAIFKIVDLEVKEVAMPEWSGSVCVRGLTARERDQFEASVGIAANLDNLRARLVVLTACDKEGKRIFTDADTEELGEKNSQAVDRLFEVARKMSGMTDADVEELEGN